MSIEELRRKVFDPLTEEQLEAAIARWEQGARVADGAATHEHCQKMARLCRLRLERLCGGTKEAS